MLIFICAVFLIFNFSNHICWSFDIIHNDIPSGILCAESNGTSTHYMRHMWVTSDKTIALIVQQSGVDGHFISLFTSRDHGVTWDFHVDIADGFDIISDGIMDEDDNILLVTSSGTNYVYTDIKFIMINRDKTTGEWNPTFKRTLFKYIGYDVGSRATISKKEDNTIACAFRVGNPYFGIWNIAVVYSHDYGKTWIQSELVLGEINNQPQKNPRIMAIGNRFFIVYQDSMIINNKFYRFKRFAKKGIGPQWETSNIALMESNFADPLGTHWSVTTDKSKNIHVSYEDGPQGYGIKYVRYDFAKKKWLKPVVIASNGIYSNVSASDDGRIVFFRDFQDDLGKYLIARVYLPGAGFCGPWSYVSSTPLKGRVRLSTVERFTSFLPVINSETQDDFQHLIFNLLDLRN